MAVMTGLRYLGWLGLLGVEDVACTSEMTLRLVSGLETGLGLFMVEWDANCKGERATTADLPTQTTL